MFIALIIILIIYQIYIAIQRQLWVAQFLVVGGRITKGTILKGFLKNKFHVKIQYILWVLILGESLVVSLREITTKDERNLNYFK